jgi:cytochrome oxidase Cu insertion factor (SCO1/SenC/PrrC family)
MTYLGTFGVPRRHWDISFANAPFAVELHPAVDMFLAALGRGGLLAAFAALSYIAIAVLSVFFGTSLSDTALQQEVRGIPQGMLRLPPQRYDDATVATVHATGLHLPAGLCAVLLYQLEAVVNDLEDWLGHMLEGVAMSPRTTGESMLPLGVFLAWLAVTMMWWALAFAPLPATPPEWLTVARQVCFGVATTGWPAGYGWLLLFLGPAPMLGFLLALWGQQLRGNFYTLSCHPGGRLAIGLMVAVPLVGAVWVGQRLASAVQMTTVSPATDRLTAFPADYPRLHRPAPDIRLVDQHGRLTALEAQRGQVLMLTFAFAHCQTICPTMVQTARSALHSLSDVAPGLWVVTLDPWRDTPGALPGLAAQWQLTQANMRLLSADVTAVLAVLSAYEVPHQRDLRTGDITHAGLVYIIDGNGRLAYALNNPSRAWLTEAVRRAARANLS